jgi:hypothetical protein
MLPASAAAESVTTRVYPLVFKFTSFRQISPIYLISYFQQRIFKTARAKLRWANS